MSFVALRLAVLIRTGRFEPFEVQIVLPLLTISTLGVGFGFMGITLADGKSVLKYFKTKLGLL